MVDIHEKSMQPRNFIFCFYLPKMLSGGVLVPSDPSLDPLEGGGEVKMVDIHEKSMQPRIFRFCFYLPKMLSGDVLAHSDP